MSKCARCGKEAEKLVGRRAKGVCRQCARQIDAVMDEAFERVMDCEQPRIQKWQNGAETVTYDSRNDAVLTAVMREVEKQAIRWGCEHDDQHTCVDWVNIIDDLVEEFEFGTIISEQMEKLESIAAVCISALRSIERTNSTKEETI